MAFHLHHDLPGYELDEEWRALLAKQARILEAMLTHVADTIAIVSASPQQEQAQQLHDVLNKTEQFLTTMAQQNIGLEQEGAAFQAIDTGTWPLPTETASRLQVLDQVNAIFHANLMAARRYLEETRQRLAHADKP